MIEGMSLGESLWEIIMQACLVGLWFTLMKEANHILGNWLARQTVETDILIAWIHQTRELVEKSDPEDIEAINNYYQSTRLKLFKQKRRTARYVGATSVVLIFCTLVFILIVLRPLLWLL